MKKQNCKLPKKGLPIQKLVKRKSNIETRFAQRSEQVLSNNRNNQKQLIRVLRVFLE